MKTFRVIHPGKMGLVVTSEPKAESLGIDCDGDRSQPRLQLSATRLEFLGGGQELGTRPVAQLHWDSASMPLVCWLVCSSSSSDQISPKPLTPINAQVTPTVLVGSYAAYPYLHLCSIYSPISCPPPPCFVQWELSAPPGFEARAQLSPVNQHHCVRWRTHHAFGQEVTDGGGEVKLLFR